MSKKKDDLGEGVEANEQRLGGRKKKGELGGGDGPKHNDSPITEI